MGGFRRGFAACALGSLDGAQRYFSVRTLDRMDRNLSQAAWASAVKSAGKCEATVTSRQWDRSWGAGGLLRARGWRGPGAL